MRGMRGIYNDANKHLARLCSRDTPCMYSRSWMFPDIYIWWWDSTDSDQAHLLLEVIAPDYRWLISRTYNLRSAANLIGILFCLSVISGVVFRSITSAKSLDTTKTWGILHIVAFLRGVRIDGHRRPGERLHIVQLSGLSIDRHRGHGEVDTSLPWFGCK